MWVLVDGDRTQVVTTLGAREGVFVEVSEDRPWGAVKQERNAKGEIVTHSIELTEELQRIVENAQFDREWPEGEKRPVVRLVEQSGVTPRLAGDAGNSWTHADGTSVNPVAAKILDGVAKSLAVDRDEELRIAWRAMERTLVEFAQDYDGGTCRFYFIAPGGRVLDSADASTALERRIEVTAEVGKAIDPDLVRAVHALVDETICAGSVSFGESSLVVSIPLPIRAKSSADKPKMSAPGVAVHPAHGRFGSTPYPGNDKLEWEKLSLNDPRAIQEEALLPPLTLPVMRSPAGYQKLRDRVAASLADPQPISKDAALALLDCAITAERAASYMEERREAPVTTVVSLGDLGEYMDEVKRDDAQMRSITKDALVTLLHCAIIADRAADHIEESRTEDTKRWKEDFEFAHRKVVDLRRECDTMRAENAQLREAISGYAGQVVALADEERARYRIHHMDTPPPEDGVYVVWQKWPAETPLAGVAPTLRSFAAGRWSARDGSDAGWSFVPKGVL